MKGKDNFTASEISELRRLIKNRIKADRQQQKSIRSKMRRIGFFGGDDFSITNLQPNNFELLIKSGRIKIVGEDVPQDLKSEKKVKSSNNKNSDLSELNSKEIDLNEFLEFNPLSDDKDKIPDKPGNYIVCLNPNSKLPDVNVQFKTEKINNLEVIYTGISSKSLRKRDYKQHFNGNSGSSTLRKSIGSMFKYKHIPRDKDPESKKTKFTDADEIELSLWMKNNLFLYYYKNGTPAMYEDYLISTLNPPLNLKKNKNIVNQSFRKELSKLRNVK